ncbi:MAG: response regulator transcription factor [Microcoleaceae cyanobacterium]
MNNKTVTILVIEDEVDICENLEEILELSDYQVLAARNGQIGLELAREHIPDLILCDVMMPGLDGYQVIEALRQSSGTARIPVIFLTAKADRSDIRHGMNLGADDYITKPFLPNEVLNAISSRLERQTLYQAEVQQERQKVLELKITAAQHQQKSDRNEQAAQLKDDLIAKLISDLSNPVSTINLALKMLCKASTEEQRQHYLKILQSECAREIRILNEATQLQKLLTDDVSALQSFLNFNHED